MRRYRVWSPFWWWELVGPFAPYCSLIFLPVCIVIPALLHAAFHGPVPLTEFVRIIALASVIVPAVTVCVALGVLFSHKDGLPSDALAGRLVASTPATFNVWSDGYLLVTDRMIYFNPNWSRATGKRDEDDVEVVMPFSEFETARRSMVMLVFPLGLTITRTSGDEERFTVGRPHYVIREIKKAREAWLARQQGDQAALNQAEAIDKESSDHPDHSEIRRFC